MSTFDTAAVRQAVAEFTPPRPEKFHDLVPAKEVIAELRQKRASYRAIAELLTKHCLPTSKTAIAMFCHEVLGEIIRPHRRQNRKRIATASPNPAPPVAEPRSSAGGNGAKSSQARGPRIAQVRMLVPQTK